MTRFLGCCGDFGQWARNCRLLEGSVPVGSSQPELSHQPLHRTASNARACLIGLGSDLLDAVDGEVVGRHAHDLNLQQLVSDTSG